MEWRNKPLLPYIFNIISHKPGNISNYEEICAELKAVFMQENGCLPANIDGAVEAAVQEGVNFGVLYAKDKQIRLPSTLDDFGPRCKLEKNTKKPKPKKAKSIGGPKAVKPGKKRGQRTKKGKNGSLNFDLDLVCSEEPKNFPEKHQGQAKRRLRSLRQSANYKMPGELDRKRGQSPTRSDIEVIRKLRGPGNRTKAYKTFSRKGKMTNGDEEGRKSEGPFPTKK